jgi:tripartite-type tricarboxylate transporter receptor subunit TctC
MHYPIRLATFISSALIFGIATGICAQSYPAKPIRILTSQAASGNDIMARIVAQGISPALGQPIVIDNRPGGAIAGDVVSKAPADGYTLLVYANSLWQLPLLRKSVPYDMRDFAPVALISVFPNVLAVHSSVPVKSVKELISIAKAQPDKLNDGSPTVGTSSYMAAELFKFMANVKIMRIPYKGGAQVLSDLLSGQVDLAFVATTTSAPHIQSGRLRALGVTSLQPSRQFPNVPTIASQGLPGYESVAQVGMLAPVKTPESVINRLHQEVRRVIDRTDTREKFLGMGVDPPADTAPDFFAAQIKSEIVKWSKVIKETGMRDDE